ncbi:uncharacterized protein APUU_40467S [Aspergillus puulaauensis]|uniref:Uncharacterized protein n=1 Tax=Aspergillus puulaauensis TaxID=1220207 RepID=A0A7R8ANP9_9EURO|nr:uncharacterized protein APUU_40467S [Aspergillus puulaauensis]BCS24023.1 hypothetical protein APUU_40467S [Aspergillus puulaauensis]
MPRSFRSRSFSSSSFSTSTSSSFSSDPVSGRSIARTPSTQKLKRWLSSHILRRPSPDLDFTHHYHHRMNNNNNKWSNSDIISHSQQSSTIQVSPNQAGLIGQPRFTHFYYDHEYPDYESLDGGQAQAQRHAGSHQQQGHDGDEIKAVEGEEEDEREKNIALCDNYAAFCRAFTSSPVDYRNIPRQPLPRLPPSTPCEEYEDHVGPVGNPASAEDVSQVIFLPVGAHGYHPASWTLPRAPSPPPGILTPRRYEELQQQQRREESLRHKTKRRKGAFMWCMLARTSWWPWARKKES